MLTRADLEQWARRIWGEALAADEPRTIEVTAAITGGEVFAWSALTVRQLRALSRTLFSTARLGA